MNKADIHSPMEMIGTVPDLKSDSGECVYDHLDAPFSKPRSGGGLPVVMKENIPGASVPNTASVPGNDGDLRYAPGTQGKV